MEPLDKLIDSIRQITKLPHKEDKMICNRCVKQDVCVLKASTECAEDTIKANFPHIEADCKHREPATDAQMSKIKQRADYALPTA
jgi:hypothetical protein